MKKTRAHSEEVNTSLIPVTIITGFLGSGKTTLLNQILTKQKGVKTAVLVNEFGEIGIDNDLIIKTGEDIIELTNGCICCTLREDLLVEVAKLAKSKKFDYLLSCPLENKRNIQSQLPWQLK